MFNGAAVIHMELGFIHVVIFNDGKLYDNARRIETMTVRLHEC